MEQQASWVRQEVRLDPIFAVAAQVGMTRPQFDACLQNQAMIEGLKWVKDRGRKLGVIGTPNFFIEGKLVKKELTMEDIRDHGRAVDRGAAPRRRRERRTDAAVASRQSGALRFVQEPR